MLVPWKKSYEKLNSVLKGFNHFTDKRPHSKSSGFSSRHVQIRELDHKEG